MDIFVFTFSFRLFSCFKITSFFLLPLNITLSSIPSSVQKSFISFCTFLIFTDHVRSMTEGYVFTGVCLLTGGRWVPRSNPDGGGGTPRYLPLPPAKVPTPPRPGLTGGGGTQFTYPPPPPASQGTYPPGQNSIWST